MQHPLEKMPEPNRRRCFWSLLVASGVLVFIFAVTGASLNTGAAPQGIISLQMAGNVTKASEMIASWDSKARLLAAFGLGLDYLFMPVYAMLIGLGCIATAEQLRRSKWPLATLGSWLAWGLCLAAIFDALENIAQMVMLLGPVVSPWPEISAVCAYIKFGLIFTGMVYAFYGVVVWGLARLTPKGSATL
jgi:hypothetical protein